MLILKNRNPTALVSVVHIADTYVTGVLCLLIFQLCLLIFYKNFDLLYICITDKEKDKMLLT